MIRDEFRCHPSIIVANSLRVLLAAAVAICSFLPEVLAGEDEALPTEQISLVAPIAAVLMVALLAIYLIVRYFAWKRTYISLQGAYLIYDKHTRIFRKKTKVRLTQIAAVHLQKGIIDRLFGTYTVKLDFDSSFTAEKTDFHLVFHESLARQFEAAILSAKQNATKQDEAPLDAEPAPLLCFTVGQILRHALFLTPIWGVVAFGAAVAGIALPFLKLSPLFYPVIFLAGLPVAFLIAFSGSLVRNLLLYYGFTLSRTGAELIISFGLITRRTYRLPIAKTNAVLVKQSVFGRIFGMYYAELLQVGMGSETDQIAPLLCLMLKREEMEKLLRDALPTFAEPFEVQASPRSAFWPTVSRGAVPMLALSLAVLAFGWVNRQPLVPAVSIPVLVMLWLLIAFAAYRAKGIAVDAGRLVVASGVLGRQFLILPYRKVQILTVKTGPISRALGLYCGVISVLATHATREHRVGYFSAEHFRKLAALVERSEEIF